MLKQVELLKKVSFQTNFGLKVSKYFDETEMNESFIDTFVKDIFKVENTGNNIKFIFEDRSIFVAKIKYIEEFLKDTPSSSVLDLINIAKLIESKDPIDKRSF